MHSKEGEECKLAKGVQRKAIEPQGAKCSQRQSHLHKKGEMSNIISNLTGKNIVYLTYDI